MHFMFARRRVAAQNRVATTVSCRYLNQGVWRAGQACSTTQHLVASLKCIVLIGDVRRRPPFTADCVSIGNESLGLRRLHSFAQRSHHGHELLMGCPSPPFMRSIYRHVESWVWVSRSTSCVAAHPGRGWGTYLPEAHVEAFHWK